MVGFIFLGSSPGLCRANIRKVVAAGRCYGSVAGRTFGDIVGVAGLPRIFRALGVHVEVR